LEGAEAVVEAEEEQGAVGAGVVLQEVVEVGVALADAMGGAAGAGAMGGAAAAGAAAAGLAGAAASPRAAAAA